MLAITCSRSVQACRRLQRKRWIASSNLRKGIRSRCSRPAFTYSPLKNPTKGFPQRSTERGRTAGNDMAHDVFISYSSSDKAAADAVCAKLESLRIRCWIAPRDISPGTEWSLSIVDAIEASRAFVLIFSRQANNSTQIAREVERAVNRGLPIIPLRIEDVVPSRSIAYYLGAVHWLDALYPPLEMHLEKLAVAISAILGVEGKVAAAVPAKQADTNRALAERITGELYVNRIEDLAALSVSRSLRQVLDSLAPKLPGRLDRIARQSDQILRLQDPGRRLEATESALRSLAEIQSELLDQSSAIADAVIRIAARWADLLTGAREAAQAAVEEARELENPFIFGNPIHAWSDGLFTGRRDIAVEIERNILRAAQTPTFLLYGQRRMGKTSILNQLPTLLGPGFLPVTIDCQAPATVESQPALLRHVSRCLSSALNLRLGITHNDVQTRQTKGAEPLPLDALQNDSFSVFEDWLDGFQAQLPTDTHVLLCLDEFERLNETVIAGWGTRFLDALRHWLQHRPCFALMFIGSHTFEQLGPAWTDRFSECAQVEGELPGRCRHTETAYQTDADFQPEVCAGSIGSDYKSYARSTIFDPSARIGTCTLLES